MDKNRTDQRKELIFRILDDLKERGERVNADKVAKLAQMGKQTVLPYYNEWRFLDQAEKQEDTELPADLVRVLKRLLVQWREEVSEKLQHFQAKSEQEINSLNNTIESLNKDNRALQDKLEHNQEDISHLEEANAGKNSEIQEQRQLVAALEAKLENEKSKVASLEKTIETNNEAHLEALSRQEEKLDNQYRNQVDHWMKTLDEERQQKNNISKEIEKLNAEALNAEKEKGSLQARLEHKTQAYIEACEERNSLRETIKKNTPSLELLSRLNFILESNDQDPLARVRELLDCEQHCKQLEKEITNIELQEKNLKTEISANQSRLESMRNLELELEKSRGYIAALEKGLSQPSEKNNK